MKKNIAQGFLEDIIANPEDDAPRLIFSDWLEEQGDNARAEFIRVQIQRSRLPKWDARQIRLRLREEELLEQHGKEWRAGLPQLHGLTWGEFRRGFLATATFSSFRALTTHAHVCWSTAPIEAITTRSPRSKEAIPKIQPIAGLRELSINSTFVDWEEVRDLANSPLLSTLHTLTLRDCSLGTDGFRRLMRSPHLGNCKALRVPHNSIGNGGIEALLEAQSLTSLTELDMSEVAGYGRYGEDPIVDPFAVQALASWSGMSSMRSLTLSGNSVGYDGLRALLRSEYASGLKELVLRGNQLEPVAIQEFESALPELQLDVLDLSENFLEGTGVRSLGRAACLQELKVLKLELCEMQLSDAREFADSLFLQTLLHLSLIDNNFYPEGLQALLERDPRALHTLHLQNNDLGDEGASLIANSPVLDNLLELDLSSNELGERSVEALTQTEHLRNLLILRLNFNQISNEAGDALAKSALGERLAILEPKDDDWDVNRIPF